MELIIFLVLIILGIILIKIIFNVKIKEIKELKENKKLKKVTNKFPNNKEIAKELLAILDNKNVKIEEAKNTRN